MVHEKNWRASLSVQETLSSTSFSLNSSGKSEYNGSAPFYIVVFVFILFWIFGWLGQQRVAPFCSFNMWTLHKCWMGIYPTQIIPCSSLTVAWLSCGWWSRRAWRRCRMINLLSWKCHWCWRMRTGGRTCWQAWNHDRNEVLRITLYTNTVFLMRCGFWPLIHS